ncbi:MAG: hypothetical protein ACO3P4_02250 [Polynucleobacter sp.]
MEVVERQPPDPTAKDVADLSVISNRQRLQRRENENRTIKNAVWRSKQ